GRSRGDQAGPGAAGLPAAGPDPASPGAAGPGAARAGRAGADAAGPDAAVDAPGRPAGGEGHGWPQARAAPPPSPGALAAPRVWAAGEAGGPGHRPGRNAATGRDADAAAAGVGRDAPAAGAGRDMPAAGVGRVIGGQERWSGCAPARVIVWIWRRPG